MNDEEIRRTVVKAAGDRYGYEQAGVKLRLYVGRLASPMRGHHQESIRRWAAKQRIGSGAIAVFGLDQVVAKALTEAASKQYRDNPYSSRSKWWRPPADFVPNPSDACGPVRA